MPALLTHDFFGKDLYELTRNSSWFPYGGKISPEAVYHMFLLGNQGPDPFLYSQLTPSYLAGKQFGGLLHHEKVEEVFEAFRRIALSLSGAEQDLVYSYLLGFVCHYTLDSIVHPFVYSQEYAICDAGVKGLDRRDHFQVHGQIEADLDMMMLRQRKGVGPRKYNYTHDVLKAEPEMITLLNSAFQALAHEVYSVNLPEDAFIKGMRDMRLTIRLLYSPRGIKRSLFGKVERLFYRHSHAQAMSPRHDVGETCDFDNQKRAQWVDPFKGTTHTASFIDLFELAKLKAAENISALVDGRPALEITNGLNYEGSSVLNESWKDPDKWRL